MLQGPEGVWPGWAGMGPKGEGQRQVQGWEASSPQYSAYRVGVAGMRGGLNLSSLVGTMCSSWQCSGEQLHCAWLPGQRPPQERSWSC